MFRNVPARTCGGPIDFRDPAALEVVLAQGPVAITNYFPDGRGLSGSNIAKRRHLATFIASLRVPWVMLGDQKVEPDELRRGGRLLMRDGDAQFLTPLNTSFTSFVGRGGLLDLGTASRSLMPLVQPLEATEKMGQRTTHKGLVLTLKAAEELRALHAQGMPPPARSVALLPAAAWRMPTSTSEVQRQMRAAPWACGMAPVHQGAKVREPQEALEVANTVFAGHAPPLICIWCGGAMGFSELPPGGACQFLDNPDDNSALFEDALKEEDLSHAAHER